MLSINAIYVFSSVKENRTASRCPSGSYKQITRPVNTWCRDHFGSSDQRFADRRGCVTARQLRRSPLPVFLTAIARRLGGRAHDVVGWPASFIKTLAGKARDVVKVSLRSFPGPTAAVLPSTVFDILKRNFSELTYSTMPMANFYNTLPQANESPMDYWIRLNKSIDVADECLRRRNKCVEDPAAEAVMMFVSHCPDPGFALSFQFKPAEQWTAAENAVTVSDDTAPNIPKQIELSSGQSPCSNGQLNPNASPFIPNASMQQLVGMMDKVLSLCTASLSSNPGRTVRTSDLKSSVIKLKSPCVEEVSMGDGELPLDNESDPQEIFVNSCKLLPPDKTVLYVGSQKIDGASDLFYAPVTVLSCVASPY
ncbi:hypothetical protein QQF64_034332 [Cirrhinus molitorella]|uniref:Uncharacterized protein n=1 Tax=Cirrhinus molitorella TaxID=172907 RepID=A0ABR3L1G0_9TELE